MCLIYCQPWSFESQANIVLGVMILYVPYMLMPFLTSEKFSTSSGYDVQKFYLTIIMLLCKSIQNHNLIKF